MGTALTTGEHISYTSAHPLQRTKHAVLVVHAKADSSLQRLAQPISGKLADKAFGKSWPLTAGSSGGWHGLRLTPGLGARTIRVTSLHD